jgi:hypothetical protein
MKKIILTALTVLMIFGLVGCSGVLHNTPAPVQEAVKIDGASWYSYDITVWGNNDPADEKPSNIIINDNGKGKQTVDTKLPAFEASKGGVAYYTLDATKPLKDGKFELNVAYQDDNPAYTAKPGVLRVYVYTNLENPTIYIWDDADCPFEKSSAWPGSPIALAGVEAGTPFYLHGFFVRGLDNDWKCYGTNVLKDPTTDIYGNVEYVYDFDASATEMGFGIANEDWNPKYHNATFTVGTDKDFVKTDLNNKDGKDNFIKGLKSGSAYRLVVKTTPAGDVYIKAFEIAKALITFEVTDLEAGNEAWMNGTFWGSDWPQGWPIASWNKDKKDGFVAAVAGGDGVATFAETWNITVLASLGETKSYEFKAIACTDSAWADADVLNPKDNLKAEIKLEKSGTYKVSVNAKTQKVTVTKPL